MTDATRVLAAPAPRPSTRRPLRQLAPWELRDLNRALRTASVIR